eukprot:6492247-Amphidinium_carterae.2
MASKFSRKSAVGILVGVYSAKVRAVSGEVVHRRALPCNVIAIVKSPVLSTCRGTLSCLSTPIACHWVPGNMRLSIRLISCTAGPCLSVLLSMPCCPCVRAPTYNSVWPSGSILLQISARVCLSPGCHRGARVAPGWKAPSWMLARCRHAGCMPWCRSACCTLLGEAALSVVWQASSGTAVFT